MGLHFDPFGIHPPLITWLDPELPAAACGLIAVGDSLLAAAGCSTIGLYSVHNLIAGEPGTAVRLRLRRPGAEYEVDLVRGGDANHAHAPTHVSARPSAPTIMSGSPPHTSPCRPPRIPEPMFGAARSPLPTPSPPPPPRTHFRVLSPQCSKRRGS